MFKHLYKAELPKLTSKTGGYREPAIVVIPVDIKASGELLLVEWLDTITYREVSRHGKDDLGLAVLAAKAALAGAVVDNIHAAWDMVVRIKTDTGNTVALVMTADCLQFGLDRLSALLLETGEWGVQPVK